jgi:hypothetical protein
VAWYRSGTAAFTNGNATVTGSGTAWIANASIGEGLLGPDGRTYEITDIASNTSLTISPAYLGSTASGQSYAIAPLRGRIADLIGETQSLLASFATVRDGIGAGLFPDGSAATPAFRFNGDQDTGIYRAGSNVLGIATGGVGRVILDGNGNLGIGNASLGANAKLAVMSSDVYAATFNTTSVTASSTAISIGGYLNAGGGTGGTGAIRVYHNHAATAVSDMAFELSGGTEVMRIKGTGNVGIATTNAVDPLTVLGGIQAAGFYRNINVAASGSAGNYIVVGALNGTAPTPCAAFGGFLTSDASAGALQLYARLGGALVERLQIEQGGAVRPGSDNSQPIGAASFRWSTVYAVTGAINTSDEREKHWRGELNAAEFRAAKRIIAELGIYQWNDAVAEKGEDGARLHFGVRAQRAFQIMEEEGLNWGRYAWACYDQWEEQTEPVLEEVTVTKTRKVMRPSTLIDPATGQPAVVEVDEAYEETEMQPTGETRVTLEAGDRYGVRPDQLAFWLIAAQAAMQAELEARIAALEAAA